MHRMVISFEASAVLTMIFALQSGHPMMPDKYRKIMIVNYLAKQLGSVLDLELSQWKRSKDTVHKGKQFVGRSSLPLSLPNHGIHVHWAEPLGFLNQECVKNNRCKGKQVVGRSSLPLSLPNRVIQSCMWIGRNQWGFEPEMCEES